MEKKKYSKPFFHAQERFREHWLSKKDEYPERTRCLWQDTRGIKGTRVLAIECWQVGPKLYIVELFDEGSYVVFCEEPNNG